MIDTKFIGDVMLLLLGDEGEEEEKKELPA